MCDWASATSLTPFGVGPRDGGLLADPPSAGRDDGSPDLARGRPRRGHTGRPGRRLHDGIGGLVGRARSRPGSHRHRRLRASLHGLRPPQRVAVGNGVPSRQQLPAGARLGNVDRAESGMAAVARGPAVGRGARTRAGRRTCRAVERAGLHGPARRQPAIRRDQRAHARGLGRADRRHLHRASMSTDGLAQPLVILHGGGIALSCALDGTVSADELHGLFASDTRVLSTYRITLGGVGLQLLSRTRDGHGTADWHYQNRVFRSAAGDVPASSIFVLLRRRVDGALHDDLQITSYCDNTIRTNLIVQVDADFADIFEVKRQQLPPRVGVRRNETETGVLLEFRRGDFERALDVSIQPPEARPSIVGSRLVFDLELSTAVPWSCCLEAIPWIDHSPMAFSGNPHGSEAGQAPPVTVVGADAVAAPFHRGCADLHALMISDDDTGRLVAAGAPWFLTLFGRDSLVTALMTGMLGPDLARAALASVGALQATELDDWRDAEPGKLPHELRRGELAARGLTPHTPYYGTHDAQALYCLALWNAWRWTGDRQLLDQYLPTARSALEWCDRYGDLDGDGLQEYRTRSRDGYYNQGWKDAGDAIVAGDGSRGSLPLATVELQGYLYAARLAMAELFEESGEVDAATQQRDRA